MNDLLGQVRPERARRPSDAAAPRHGDLEMGHRRTGSEGGGGSMLEGGTLNPLGPAMAHEAAENANREMDEFYAQVSELKALLSKLQKYLKALQTAQQRFRDATRSEDMQGLRQEMQESISDVGRLAKEGQARLERLDGANEEARARGGKDSCQDRTRTTITNSLRKKLRDLLGEFANVRGTIQEEYRDTVARRYFTVTGARLEGEALEAMIESGESESIFRSALMDAGRAHILDTVTEIQERHDAFKDLERKLLELHQVFMDMAVLVEAQGELLDNIEANVGRAVDYVEQGNTSLVSAKRIQRNTRKWACCAIGILLAIVFVIVVAVLKPWQTGDA